MALTCGKVHRSDFAEVEDDDEEPIAEVDDTAADVEVSAIELMVHSAFADVDANTWSSIVSAKEILISTDSINQ